MGWRGTRTTLPHQLLRQPQPAVRAHDAQAGDVPVLHAVDGLLLHLREDVADDLGGVVGGAGRAGDVDGDVGELRPGEGVVEVVLEEVVLRQVGDVGGLHVRDVGGEEDADVHCWQG